MLNSRTDKKKTSASLYFSLNFGSYEVFLHFYVARKSLFYSSVLVTKAASFLFVQC